jgi:hypothetical protein
LIVHYAPDEGLTLQEGEVFRRYKIVLDCGSQQCPQVPELTFVDDDNALIGIDVAPALCGVPTDPVWRAEYDRVISSAAKFGWTNETSNLTHAHVERTSP